MGDRIRAVLTEWDSLPDEVWALVIGAMYRTRREIDLALPFRLRPLRPEYCSLKTTAARQIASSLIESLPNDDVLSYIRKRGIEPELEPPPHKSYLSFDTTHKLVCFQTERRSVEFVTDLSPVDLAQLLN